MKLIVDLIMNIDEKFSFQCNSPILVICLDVVLANQWIHEFNKFTKNLKVYNYSHSEICNAHKC
jgi:hypothetical protein